MIPRPWPAIVLSLVLASGCAGPRRTASSAPDPELSRLNTRARAAYDRGSLPLAITLYGQALTRARALDDAGAIGNAAYNLAVCRIPLGEYEPAQLLLSDAEAELTRVGANLADVLLMEAKLARWQDRRDDAVYLGGQVLANPGSQPTAAHRAEVALLLGSLACDDSDVVSAQTALDQARQETNATTDTTLRAGCEQLSGRIQLLEEQPAAAAQAFDREALHWQRARRPRALVGALMRAGEAWSEAGQPAAAAERFFRAARSSLAQGLREQARRCVQLSLSRAAEAGQETLRARALQLQSEIMNTLRPQQP